MPPGSLRITATETPAARDNPMSTLVSDATLVHGTLGGDRGAFAALYDRWGRMVRAVCWDESREAAAAADLAQEAFLRAYRELGQLREPQRFGAWVVGIARQVCREWRRGKFRRLRLLGDAPDDAIPTARLHAGETAPDAQLAELRMAVAQLPQLERTALHAFYLQELDADRARVVCGLSRSGLYRVLSRARERLRRLLRMTEATR